jgi:hypothetical protein
MAIAGDFGPEALALDLELLSIDPNDRDARTRLARCYREVGRADEARSDYEEVLRRDPKNRIAAGALDDLKLGGLSASTLAARPVPHSFSGFRQEDFAELQVCPQEQIRERFGPRVVDLVKRINALPSSPEVAAIRNPQQRALFRTGLPDVHTDPRHWYKPQFEQAGDTLGRQLRVSGAVAHDRRDHRGPDDGEGVLVLGVLPIVLRQRGSLALDWHMFPDPYRPIGADRPPAGRSHSAISARLHLDAHWLQRRAPNSRTAPELRDPARSKLLIRKNRGCGWSV